MPLTTENAELTIGRWTAEQLAEARVLIRGLRLMPPPWLTPDVLLYLVGAGIKPTAAEAIAAIDSGKLALSDGVRIAEVGQGGLIPNLKTPYVEPPFIDGDVVLGTNAIQLRPGTEVCTAVRELRIIGGNLTNIKLQPTWTIGRCNTNQVEFCTHNRPKLVALGLTACKPDCKHLVPGGPQWLSVSPEDYRRLRREGGHELRRVDTEDPDGIAEADYQLRRNVYLDRPLQGAEAIAARGRR